MRSGMVAVWDADREYGQKISEYLRRRGNYTVVCFQDRQKLRQAWEQGQIEVLLTGEEDRGEWPGQTPIIVLTQHTVGRESSGQKTSEQEAWEQEISGQEDKPGVHPRYFYKYQPARELLRLLSGMGKKQEGAKMAYIRGIYSPFGGCLKTSLGLVMGCLLAEDRRCLFVSLEAHAGFRTLFGRQYPMDLSDLFMTVRQDKDVAACLAETLQPFGKLQYIPPVIWPVDVREAEFSELKELLQRLACCGEFDEIVLDVGQDLACPEKVLQLCDVIYQPVKEDIFSQAKLAEYEAYLRICGQESLCQRTRSIPVSHLSLGAEGASLDQWQRWEQMIPVVRQILLEDDHEQG